MEQNQIINILLNRRAELEERLFKNKPNMQEAVAEHMLWHMGGNAPSYNSMCSVFLVYVELHKLEPEMNVLEEWEKVEEEWLRIKYTNERYRNDAKRKFEGYKKSILDLLDKN